MSESSLTLVSVRRSNGMATLTLSNGETLRMPRAMLRERPYRSGMPFDQAAFDTWMRERAYAFAMDKAIFLLAARSRTEQELCRALAQNAYPETAIARVMARLHEAGYINDADFADRWASSRTQKGMGMRRIRMELRYKGVDATTIDQTLSALDTDAQLESAHSAARKAARGRDLSLPAERQKVLAALARRGYDFSTAKQALSLVMDDAEE